MPRTTKLNDTQLRLIQMFEFASTKKDENELMQVLQDYYMQKFIVARKRVMRTGKFKAADIDKYVQTHQHGKLVKC